MPRRSRPKSRTPAKPSSKSPIRGDRLRELREARGWRQRDAVQGVAITESEWSRLERETGLDPRASKLLTLCRRLGCSADYLLGLSDTPNAGG